MPKHDKVVIDELRASLADAHQDMRMGKDTDAVRTLSDVYLYMLKKNPELLDEQIDPRPGFKMFVVVSCTMLGRISRWSPFARSSLSSSSR